VVRNVEPAVNDTPIERPGDGMSTATDEVASQPRPAAVREPRSGKRLETPDGVALELNGIAWSETGPFALINGRVMGPGERIAGFQVLEISPRTVELSGPGGSFTLTLD
jgi:hypothetical protein